MKSQYKIAISLIVGSVFLFLSFGIAIYSLVQSYSLEDFYKRLKTRATIAAQYRFDVGFINAESYKRIREVHLEKLDNEKEYFFKANDDTDIINISNVTNLPVSFIQKILSNNVVYLKIKDTFYAGIRYSFMDDTHVVIVSANNYYASHHLLYMQKIIVGIMVIAFVIILILSIYISKKIYEPITHLADTVKKISTDNIHLRIEAKYNDKEISQLIATFNDLLNRLETSFAIQNNFISNASHEFSTPLTAIMGEAEVILLKERTPAEYKESLMNILHQTERLSEITQTLLHLAETGYTNKLVHTQIIRSDELIWEAKAIVNKLNPGNNIKIDMSLLPENPRKLKVNGNKSLLLIAITNILNNACKYSDNKPVSISIASSNEYVLIAIKDQGIGIPSNEMAFIYDPFFRASNTKNYEGYGIGLPLCRNIIRIHDGKMNVFSRQNQGTSVEIILPQAVLS